MHLVAPSFYRGSSAPIVKLAPNAMFPHGRSAQWRRPSRRHCVRYCIKFATVCESLKTVRDASLPSRTVHALELRPSSVYRKLSLRPRGYLRELVIGTEDTQRTDTHHCTVRLACEIRLPVKTSTNGVATIER